MERSIRRRKGLPSWLSWKSWPSWPTLLLTASALNAGPARAQAPALAAFDVYGSDRIDVAALREALGTTPEDFLGAMLAGDDAAAMPAAERIEAAVEAFGPFASATLSVTQDFAPTPGFYMTIDVVEPGDAARRMPFRTLDAATAETFEDPDGLIADWYVYQDRFFALLSSGELASLSSAACPALHCLAPFEHPDLAPFLERFDTGVADHEASLRAIVERDRDAGHRAAAVFLLAHTNDAARLLPLLARAMLDPDSGVRNNAMRIMIYLAQGSPDLDFPIDTLIDAMDFAESSDRNKSAETVSVLVDQGRYREAVMAGALDTCLKLLRLDLPNNRNPAHRILMSLSGLSLPVDDFAGWERWVREAAATAP